MSCELAEVAPCAASEHAEVAPCAASEPILEENLGRLLPASARARVRATTLRRLTVGGTPEHPADLRLSGHSLCSRGDPRREAEAWAARLEVEGAELVVVVGLGLGYHLEALRRRTRAPIVVLEPCLEVVRVALSRRPLAVDGVRIFESAVALREHLISGLALRRLVTIGVWPAYRRLFPEVVHAARQAVAEAARLAAVTGNTLERRARVWARHLLANLPACAGRLPVSSLAGWLRGVPVIVVAAGPSLDRNIATLRSAAGRAVVIAVNTSLRALDRAGVRADLVVALEAIDVSSQLAGLTLNAGCPRALDLLAHPALFQGAEGPVLPFASQVPFFTHLAEAAGLGPALPIGGSAANAAFALAQHLGADPLILVGQDLAYAEDRVYASGTVFGDLRVQLANGVASLDHLEAKRALAATAPELDTTMERRAAEPALGWGGGVVWTNLELTYFRRSFEEQASLAPGRTLINATEGGARIRGFAERPLAEVLAGLPLRPLPVLPEGPLLPGAPIQRVLAHQLERARAARELAGESLAQGASSLEGLRAGLADAHLAQALAWPGIQAVRRDPRGELSQLCAELAAGAAEAAELLEAALASFPHTR